MISPVEDHNQVDINNVQIHFLVSHGQIGGQVANRSKKVTTGPPTGGAPKIALGLRARPARSDARNLSGSKLQVKLHGACNTFENGPKIGRVFFSLEFFSLDSV